MTEAGAPWALAMADEAATTTFAAKMAGWLRPGDLVTLSGDLGSGKTTFARALIRRLANDDGLEVPSPTFTIVQTYAGRGGPVVHADLYRVADPSELAELGWDEGAEDGIVLVEWADRLGGALAPDRLDIAFTLPSAGDPGRRMLLVTGHGRFAARLHTLRTVDEVLREAGFEGAGRRFLTGDASSRVYERLTRADGGGALLMISPPRTDAPVVRYGKPYHHIARLAHDIRPFLAMAAALKGQGVSVPAVLAADAAAGLAVVEDLGADPVVDADGPIPDRYAETVRLLAGLHGRALPRRVPLAEGHYDIPPYDLDALLVEVELLIDWYAPHVARVAVSASARASFMAIFAGLFEGLQTASRTWCLRDVHSPNLIWLPGRQGTARVGVIDFQDCVLGHPAYDVASLLQDARVEVPDALELKLLGTYAQQRRAADPSFDMEGFVRAYAILGVQRATKILGIFARLDKRDGKPQYLGHLPRIESYLRKGLAHPALSDIKAWFRAYVPRALSGPAV